MNPRFFALLLLGCLVGCQAGMPFVRVSPDGATFVRSDTGEVFTPWGFNYDHDEHGRLIEDYWHGEWAKVEADFAEMKALGANVVRVHLQFGKFMDAPDRANASSLKRLGDLVKLAERTGTYLDLTGLGCYHKKDVPAWYDAADEGARWAAQEAFWEAVAETCAGSPAVFCYDLMNEPVIPGDHQPARGWLAEPLGDKHFVQYLTLTPAGRDRTTIARQWLDRMIGAIRRHDRRTLVTVGLFVWSGFDPKTACGPLDFIAVHVYPESGKLDAAMDLVRRYDVGKPLVIEEVFPLKSSMEEFRQFIDDSRGVAEGHIGFYWGKTLEEYRSSGGLVDAIMAAWLEYFTGERPGE